MNGTAKPLDARFMAIIVSIPMFMGQLDSTVVITALPEMAKDFGLPAVSLSIGITIYLLVQAALLPLCNWVADRLGTRLILAVSIGGFMLTSVLCGLSQTLEQFVGARILEAVFATMMVPVGRLVLLRSTSKAELVNVMTITTVPMLLAPTLGPPIGGFITTFLDWPWIFYLNVPFGLLSLFLSWRYLPNLREDKKRPFDYVGFVLTGLSLSCLIYGMDRISQPSVDWRISASILAAGAVLGVCAYFHGRSHSHPLFSFAALKIKNFFITSITGGSLIRIPARAIAFILPIMYQVGFGWSAFGAGLLVMMIHAGDLALKPFLAAWFRRFGFPVSIMVSTAAMMVTMAACALFEPATPIWIMAVLLFLNGMFRSIVIAANVSLSFTDIPQEEMGNASMFANVMQQVVSAAGVSFATILLNVSVFARGGGGGNVTADDCRFALVGLAAIGLLALLSFRKLAPDAGLEASGHRKLKQKKPEE